MALEKYNSVIFGSSPGLFANVLPLTAAVHLRRHFGLDGIEVVDPFPSAGDP